MKKRPDPWDGQRETLDDLEGAVHYNRWIAGMMAPYVGDRLLEIGCGTGNITDLLARRPRRPGFIVGVDTNPDYLRRAREKCRDLPGVEFERLDLGRGLSPLRKFKPDTILCVNVLEHIQKDVQVLTDCYRLLPSGGRLLLFVPALQWLYGSMDVTYGHHRRYGKKELESKVRIAGFRVVGCRYLNLLGIPGWWWSGKVLKKPVIPRGPMLMYDKVVAVTRHFERFLPRPVGLSLFCAGEKR